MAELSETEYNAVLRLLFGVLGNLARKGLAIPPDEGMDLIHDFLASDWNGLADRYDPKRGAQFSTYLFSAFYRFANRRGRRLRAWKLQLNGIQELKQAPAPVETRLEGEYAAVFRVAAHRLPPATLVVLNEWLGNGLSERALCERFGESRYRIREKLVDAIGQLVVQLGESTDRPEFLSRRDWEVANALWRDAYPPSAVAKRLVMSVPEVQERRHRIYHRLVNGLKKSSETANPNGEQESAMSNAFEILAGVLSSKPHDDRLAELAQAAPEIIDALRSGGISDAALGKLPADVDPEWLAAVYETLANEDDESPSKPMMEAIEKGLSMEEKVGRIFADVLISDLPSNAGLEAAFKNCKAAPPHVVDYLRKDPSISGAGEAGQFLLNLGLSPTMVAQAASATGSLARRLIRSGRAKDMPLLSKSLEEIESDAHIPAKSVRRRILRASGCLEQSMPYLHSWLFEVATYKPFFYPRFRTQIEGDELRLIAAEKMGLEEAWATLRKP